MKTILIALTGAIALGIAAVAGPAASHDSQQAIQPCPHCGDTVMQVRHLTGHDNDGKPVYRWLPANHLCRVCPPKPPVNGERL